MSDNDPQNSRAMDVDEQSSSDDDDDLDVNQSKSQTSPPPSAVPAPAANPQSQTQTQPPSKDDFDVEITAEDYESIAILIDELMKDDPAVRIKAIRSLPIISKALGEERTRSELIPYITQMIDDDDEVLLVLIEEIYRLLTLRLIGGATVVDNEFAFCLIPPFERLCQVEEKIIRDEATSKFGQILHDMPYLSVPHYFDSYVLPLLKRLCACDWHTARISGATLIANAFCKFVSLLSIAPTKDHERLEGYKKEMLTLLIELVSDSIPIVRRSAMITLGKMVAALSDVPEVLRWYLPLFKKLAGDDQDNVRVFAVDTLLQIGRILSPAEVKEHLLYHIRLLALDQAWRVRYIAADKLIALCELLDAETIRESMINYFIRLLQDQEPEVRAVAISKIPGMSALVGVELSVEKLIPIVTGELITDSNKYARASLASIIIPFCYLLPHKVVTQHILDCILKILKDEFPNVRLHVISNICDERPKELKKDSSLKAEENPEMRRFDISLLEESIIPSIMELTLDNDWRVRMGIIEKFPALAKQFGLAFFNERLLDLCLASLEDNVADIRLAAAQNLFAITKTFAEERFAWTKATLMPAMMAKMRASKHYLHRSVYLLGMRYLVEALGSEDGKGLVTEIVRVMCSDSVANVRFKACQIVRFLVTKGLVCEGEMDGVQMKLRALIQTDDDADVRFFAERSLEAMMK